MVQKVVLYLKVFWLALKCMVHLENTYIYIPSTSSITRWQCLYSKFKCSFVHLFITIFFLFFLSYIHTVINNDFNKNLSYISTVKLVLLLHKFIHTLRQFFCESYWCIAHTVQTCHRTGHHDHDHGLLERGYGNSFRNVWSSRKALVSSPVSH